MMKYFRGFLLGGVYLVLCTPFLHAETLSEAVETTLATHPAADGAQARVETSEQQRKAASSGFFPEISLSTSAGREYADNSTSRGLSVSRGAGYSGLWEGSVSARQMLFDGMETQSRVRAARALQESAMLGVEDLREQLAMRTVQTYMNLLRTRKGLELLKGQEESVKSYLSRIKGMVDDGASDEAELQQARDVLSILENYKNDYDGQIKTLESDYFELTGRLPDGALSTPLPPVEALPPALEEAVTLAKQSHPVLKGAAFEVRAAQQNMKAEQGSLYPAVDGELSYAEVDKRDLIGGESTDAKAVVRMNWNLETGGGQLARIREKASQKKEAESRVREMERRIERGVRQAYAEYETARNQLKIQEQRADLNQKLLETYKSQFEGARITLLQLMQSDNQLLITKLEKMNAENRVHLAQYGILAAVGRLQESLRAPPVKATIQAASEKVPVGINPQAKK